MAKLSLRNVSKIYPAGEQAVRHFSLEIGDGEFVVLLGPAGCGKSTVLRMIAGLEKFSHGEIYIDDQCVNDIPPKERSVAMVFQDYALYPHMTVYDNMAFGLKTRGLPKTEIQQAIEKTAGILDITGLLSMPAETLSDEQMHLVVLGRAAVRNPKAVVLDQPFMHMDPLLKRQICANLPALQKALGITFVYSTHDQAEALAIGEKIVIMRDGCVEQEGMPEELRARPSNAFVAGFLESQPMNFAEASVERRDQVLGIAFGKSKRFFVRLPGNRVSESALSHYEGQSVIVGIRPENIRDCSSYLPDVVNGILEVQVEGQEQIDSDIYLRVSFEEMDLLAKIRPRTDEEAGGTVKVALDADQLFVFDKNTEKTILPA